jgi:hypothetical protein
MASTAPTRPVPDAATPRADVRAVLGGILFSLAFTGLIWWAGGRLDSVRLLPDQGAAWYYWKLPEPTFWTRLSAWGLYLLHQVTIWGLIYFAQSRRSKYTTELHRFNVLALGANALFILAHFAQTHVFYDGLAQDVSIFSSQGSVIVLLVAVLLMENPRRGLFFGKRAPLSAEVVRIVRKYHGYFFAWAAIYTFWYHPMVNTPGHLIGFAYMFLLMLQGSMFYTRIHVNRYWTFVQEFSVLVHGTLVAIQQGAGLWPMFLFGFGGIFVITQMHGLGLSWRSRLAILGIYAAGVVAVYSGRGLAQVNEIVRIPLIDYLAVFVLAWLIGGVLWLIRRVRGPRMVAAEG